MLPPLATEAQSRLCELRDHQTQWLSPLSLRHLPPRPSSRRCWPRGWAPGSRAGSWSGSWERSGSARTRDCLGRSRSPGGVRGSEVRGRSDDGQKTFRRRSASGQASAIQRCRCVNVNYVISHENNSLFRMNQWVSEWVNEWMNACMHERMNYWMDELKTTNEWMNEWMKINEWERINQWEWMDGRMNEW